MTTLILHPDSSPQYYNFYLAGFERCLGPLRLRFSRNDLPALLGPRDGLAVLLASGKKIFIAADDHPTINAAALAWCDVFGMVNLLPELSTASRDRRILAIGPSMGIQWRSNAQACWYLLRARAAGGNRFAGLPARVRALLKHQRQRPTLELYQTGVSRPDYLFFISSAWARHPGTISPRVSFIESAKKLSGVRFEGGIVGRDDPALAAARPYSVSEYLSKTQSSVLAFNTPAVHDCLGWKLAEFMALGKAIVSLPLSREMPQALEHGVHAHFVDGTPESIREAIERIRSDADYRHTLEQAARRYYQTWLAPEAVARRLIADPTDPAGPARPARR